MVPNVWLSGTLTDLWNTNKQICIDYKDNIQIWSLCYKLYQASQSFLLVDGSFQVSFISVFGHNKISDYSEGEIL